MKSPEGPRQPGGRLELDGGSRIGARYRHTTPEMAVRVPRSHHVDQEAAVSLRFADLNPLGRAIIVT